MKIYTRQPWCWLAAVAMLASSLPAVAREVPVRVEGCPATLTLVVPDQYRQARTVKEVALRNEGIANLHANPKRKARYSEILRADWSQDFDRIPAQIMVASLGYARGTYTRTQWIEVRNGIASMPAQDVDAYGQKGISHLQSGIRNPEYSIAFKRTPAFSSRENEVIMTAESAAQFSGAELPMLNAAKFIYAHGCISYISFAIDREEEGAIASALEFIEKVSIK